MNEIINKAAAMLASKHGINVSNLEYIGDIDCSWRNVDDVQVQFNIMCEGHIHNHSTVAVNSWNM